MAKQSKAASLDDLITQFQPGPPKYLRTGCLPFDMITGGQGLLLNVPYLLWSEEGLGKTSVTLAVCKGLAEQGHKILYMAVEYNSTLADAFGLGPGSSLAAQFQMVEAFTYHDAEVLVNAFFRSDFTLLVIDSLSALNPSKMNEDDSSAEDLNVGLVSRIRGPFLRSLCGLAHKSDKGIILINQARGSFSASWGADPVKAEGGFMTMHMPGIIVRLRGSAKVSGEGDETVGTIGTLVASKNRVVPPLAEIPCHVVFGQGVSNAYSLLHFCLWADIIRKGGAWAECQLPGGEVEKVQGPSGRDDWVRRNQAVLWPLFYERAMEYYQFLRCKGSAKSISVF